MSLVICGSSGSANDLSYKQILQLIWSNPQALLQDMLRSWSEPFREAHGHRPDVRWYELSLVESVVSRPGLRYLTTHFD